MIAILSYLVDVCRRRAPWVTLLGTVLALVCGAYSSTHFKINTDVNQLLSEDLSWRHQEKVLEQAFPKKVDTTLIVVDGDTADLAENAAHNLADRLQANSSLFSYVSRPDAIPFFRKNGLLFLAPKELSGILETLVSAQPMLGTLVSDPSLRGFFSTIGMMAQGVALGAVDKKQLEKPLMAITKTLNAALEGNDKPIGWQDLMSDDKPTLHDLRKFILTKPVLNYAQLEPGQDASDAIRAAVTSLQLTKDHGVRVRLTGSIPLNDEEFASVADGMGMATLLSLALVVAILFFALKSWRLIIPILLTLLTGLSATTAFALMTVGSLNLISVAFAVMFIGIAVDFGIQFGVRYRDQHFHEPDHAKALMRTVAIIAAPLAMAAGSTALGFIAFIPTAYRGVSELGLIAGAGMIFAFIFNITLLPALLTLFHPPAEEEAIGYAWTAPIDRWTIRKARTIVLSALTVGLLSLGLASYLRFDFDPLNLKDQHTESVSTLLDVMQDPDFSTYTVEALEPTLPVAEAYAHILEKLPEVDHVMTLSSFVPSDQKEKLALINDANIVLGPTLNLPTIAPPQEQDILNSLKQSADAFRQNTAPEAKELVKALDAVIARNDPKLYQRLKENLVDVLTLRLSAIKEALSAGPIEATTISQDLRDDWVTKDGRYRLEIYPRGNARDHHVLMAFTKAVRAIIPDASGAPISIQESGHTVTEAFVHAGIYAILAISLLAFIVLRRVGDVVRMIAPLLLAGAMTLGTMAVFQLSLNFANIIALPLLLSLGVSYAIYFVSYFKAGFHNPLQSSMARAVLFSAATTLVAFGSLSLSSHPGTSGMGKLLTLALLYSLFCTFIVLPALLVGRKNDKG